jgi:hypothetical protein
MPAPYHTDNNLVLSTTDVSKMLGFVISVRFLKTCGVSPVEELKTGTYWRRSDFPLICSAIANRLACVAYGYCED